MEVVKKKILQAVTTGLTQGYWDASVNLPNITGNTESGYTWNVSVSGDTLLGDINNWNVGDWAVKLTGNTWGRVINTITGSSGNTIIIPNLIVKYIMKIGLKQDNHDIGFFDNYPYAYGEYGEEVYGIGEDLLLDDFYI